MDGTIKLLRSIEDLSLSESPDDELCEAYQTYRYKDPQVFATMFLRHSHSITYAYTCNNYNNYINESDAVSLAMQALDSCMSNYTTTRKAEFMTYYLSVFKCLLATERKSLLYDKRCANLNTVAFAIDADDIDVQNDRTSSEYAPLICSKDNYSEEPFLDVELQNYLNSLPLNEKERKFCHYLIQGYSCSECAELLGLTRGAMTYIKKCLRPMLQNLRPKKYFSTP